MDPESDGKTVETESSTEEMDVSDGVGDRLYSEVLSQNKPANEIRVPVDLQGKGLVNISHANPLKPS
ncbi:hypothetical protein M5689_020847 [Euphorbia peplus]|nr:hypothetical protein M5689_020847 [Euphorbia peplus]